MYPRYLIILDIVGFILATQKWILNLDIVGDLSFPISVMYIALSCSAVNKYGDCFIRGIVK